MDVTVYSTNCPQCKMLESLLKRKLKIEPKIVYGADEIAKRGYHSAPILEVDGKTMSFAEAVRWVNSLKVGDGDAR